MTFHEKAKNGLLEREVLTTELLNERDEYGNTVWHKAASYNHLDQIPQHLFTADVFNQTNENEITVWQAAAEQDLSFIPIYLFTEEALSNKLWGNVWHTAAEFSTLKDIPKHLFTKDVLSLSNENGAIVWHFVAGSDTLKIYLNI